MYPEFVNTGNHHLLVIPAQAELWWIKLRMGFLLNLPSVYLMFSIRVILQFNFFSTACLKMILALDKLFTNTVLKNSSIRVFEGVKVHTWTGSLVSPYAPHGMRSTLVFSLSRGRKFTVGGAGWTIVKSYVMF